MKSTSIMLMLMILLISQFLSAQTTIGLTGGATFANVKVSQGGISASPKSRTGFTAGLFVDAPLSLGFSFQPALNFVQKGYTIKDEMSSTTEKVSFNYIEVPLNFIYSIKKNEGFFVGAGPSIAYGISGEDKTKYGAGMPDDNQKVKFGSGESEVKPFDFGANALAGYKFKGGFMVSGNYTLGLSKINNPSAGDMGGTIKNRYFGVKIGYVFGKTKHK